MIYLPQGIDFNKIREYMLTLPDIKSRLAYLNKYSADVRIIMNGFDFYFMSANIECLVGSGFEHMKEFLIRENIRLDQDPQQLLNDLVDLDQKLLFLSNNLAEEIQKYSFFAEIKHDPQVIIDTRIQFNHPEVVLFKFCDELAAGEYIKKMEHEEYLLHFRCPDTVMPFDMERSLRYPFEWYESNNKFATMWNLIIEAGFIRGNPLIKYTQIGSHILNAKHQQFKNLSHSFHNARNTFGEYTELIQLVERVKAFAETVASGHVM